MYFPLACRCTEGLRCVLHTVTSRESPESRLPTGTSSRRLYHHPLFLPISILNADPPHDTSTLDLAKPDEPPRATTTTTTTKACSTPRPLSLMRQVFPPLGEPPDQDLAPSLRFLPREEPMFTFPDPLRRLVFGSVHCESLLESGAAQGRRGRGGGGEEGQDGRGGRGGRRRRGGGEARSQRRQQRPRRGWSEQGSAQHLLLLGA